MFLLVYLISAALAYLEIRQMYNNPKSDDSPTVIDFICFIVPVLNTIVAVLFIIRHSRDFLDRVERDDAIFAKFFGVYDKDKRKDK